MSWMTRIVVASVLLSGGVAAAAPDDRGALERIDSALQDGRLDVPTHALLGLRLVRSPQSLPEEFRPRADEAPIRCGTLLARRAFLLAKAGAFDDDQQAEFAVLGGRPNYPNSLPVMVNAVQVARVHYPNGVANAAAIVAFLEQSWAAEVGTMGWRAPPPDVGAGGADPGPELDMYLDPAEFGGVTIPIQEDTCADPWNCSASFIILEPGVFNVESYVAHELNHSIQFAYDYADGDFIYEATATWMEDKVFDSVNDYEFFIADFQRAPQKTLSLADYSNTYMYGGAVFFHYLSDVYDAGGTTVVRNVWDAAKGNPDWYDGVESALAAEGFDGIADIYREFAGVRMLTGVRDDGTLEEGEDMTTITIEEAYLFDDIDNGETDSPPMGMGANYLSVGTLGAEAGDELTLRVSSDEPGPWAITTVAMPASGPATIVVFLDEDDDGDVEATVTDVASYNEVGFAITNTANANEGVDDSFGSGVSKTTHPFSWSFAGVGGSSEPSSCGCSLPAGRRSPNTVSVIAAFLVAAFSIVWRRQPPSP